MKSLAASLLLIAALTIPFLAEAEDTALVWRSIKILADNNVSLEAKVDDDFRLTTLKLRQNDTLFDVPLSVYCLWYQYDLRTIDVVQSYLLEEPKPDARPIHVSVRIFSDTRDGSETYLSLLTSDTSFDRYQIQLRYPNGEIRVPVPTRPLPESCSSR
jgi:hypothetical protein